MAWPWLASSSRDASSRMAEAGGKSHTTTASSSRGQDPAPSGGTLPQAYRPLKKASRGGALLVCLLACLGCWLPSPARRHRKPPFPLSPTTCPRQNPARTNTHCNALQQRYIHMCATWVRLAATACRHQLPRSWRDVPGPHPWRAYPALRAEDSASSSQAATENGGQAGKPVCVPRACVV